MAHDPGGGSTASDGLVTAAIEREMDEYGWYPTYGGQFANKNQSDDYGKPINGPGLPDDGRVVVDTLGSRPPVPASDLYGKWRTRITGMFSPYDDIPSVTGLHSLADVLQAAIKHLATSKITDVKDAHKVKDGASPITGNTNLVGDLADATSDLMNMDGGFIKALRRFLATLETVADNQAGVIYAMYSCVWAEIDLWTKCRTDYVNLISKATGAFQAGDGSANDADLDAIISVIGTVIEVIGLLPEAQILKSTSEGLGELSTTLGLTKKVNDLQVKKKHPLSAATAEGVWSNISAAETALRTALRAEEDAIRRTLVDIDKTVSTNANLAFDQLRQHGRRTDGQKTKVAGPGDVDERADIVSKENAVLVTPNKLRNVANDLNTTLPRYLTKAHQELTSSSGYDWAWTRPATLGIGANGAQPAFASCVRLLGSHLLDGTRTLDWAGDTIHGVAGHFTDTDRNLADSMKKLERKLRDKYAASN